MAIDATTGATKKLQELVEKVRGSDSKLTVSGAKKIDDANKLELGLFQSGLAGIKDQDPSVEARRKAAFSIGNLATKFTLNKMFGGEDALNNRKDFKKQRQNYQELKTEYLSSKFKDPETAALLYKLAPKFEEKTNIKSAQNDFDKAMFIGTFGTTENGKPVPLEEQIKQLQIRIQDGEIPTSEQALYRNEIERRNMLLQEQTANIKQQEAERNELADAEMVEFGRSANQEDFEKIYRGFDGENDNNKERYNLETGNLLSDPSEITAKTRSGLLDFLRYKKPQE
jgi:hypothetical protein